MDRIGALQRYYYKVKGTTTGSSRTVDGDAAMVTRPRHDDKSRSVYYRSSLIEISFFSDGMRPPPEWR